VPVARNERRRVAFSLARVVNAGDFDLFFVEKSVFLLLLWFTMTEIKVRDAQRAAVADLEPQPHPSATA
jgi:hypothetical protein